MALSLAAARRYARQLALPAIGSQGQEHVLAATVVVVGGDLVAETAAVYLAAGGVGSVRLIADREGAARIAAAVARGNGTTRCDVWTPPAEGSGWLQALGVAEDDTAAPPAIVVRSGLDDDACLRAAVRLGVPAVFARAGATAVDVLAFRAHGPCPHLPLDLPVRESEGGGDGGAAAIVAGTLAAAEAMWVLIGRSPEVHVRACHLRAPLDGGEPLVQEIPWTPECFLCGGGARDASFS